jgi:hypothetical protein
LLITEDVGKMGSLSPNSKLIYERVSGVTYARVEGADPSTRQEVGWDYDPRTTDGRPLVDHIRDSKLWGEIHRAAKTNPTLQKALEQCIIIYHLSKDKKEPPMWHPV